MRPNALIDRVDHPCNPSAGLVLREARRLHRAAASGSLAAALPVLRRMLNTGAVPRTTLPVLFRRRATLQRKHLLRMLAVEAGFASWEAYRPALQGIAAADLAHLEIVQPGAGHLNHWFPTPSEAQAFAARHGGRALRVGGQAVVVAPDSERVRHD